MLALENLGRFLLFMIGIFLLIQVPFVLLTFIVALWERHWTSFYVPVDESEALPSNAYMDLTNAMARDGGFEYLGVCRSGNAKLYKMRYDAWVSPDRHVFAVVGAGRMAAVAVCATWLTSKLIDGRVLISVDYPGAMSADLSGMTTWKVIMNADFHELLASHLARLEAEITPVEPYCDDDPLGEHIDLVAQRAERQAQAGYIYFLDEERQEWKYTTWGALVRLGDSYKRQYTQILRNYGRRKLSRPGDYGFVRSAQGRTRSWLLYAEWGCWIALLVVGRIWSTRPAVNPQQARFRAIVLFSAFLGLVAVWIGRWWFSRGTVDPQTRRRRRITIAAVGCLMVGGCVMMVPRREPVDTVTGCHLLIGGERAYIVVEGAHIERMTSPLAKLLERNGKLQVRRIVSWRPNFHILECDGSSTRSLRLPPHESFQELLPRGEDLYLVDPTNPDAVRQCRDGELVTVPPKDRPAILNDLDEQLAERCARQKWQYTSLEGASSGSISKIVLLGGRQVALGLALKRSANKPESVLHVKIEVSGKEPLVRTFPAVNSEGT